MAESSGSATWVGRGRMRIAVMTSVFCSLASALYAARGRPPSDRVQLYLWFVPTLAVVLWVVQDARQRHIAEVHDFDWLVWTFAPVSIPWYCFKSRGARGGLLLAGLLGLIVAPWITWMAIAWIRYAAS